MIDIGVLLERDDLSCHLWGRGEPESGKSKCIEKICRDLIIQNQGLFFGDPHGHTFYDLLSWLAYVKPRRRKINIIDTTTPHTQGIRAFYSESKEKAHLTDIAP